MKKIAALVVVAGISGTIVYFFFTHDQEGSLATGTSISTFDEGSPGPLPARLPPGAHHFVAMPVRAVRATTYRGSDYYIVQGRHSWLCLDAISSTKAVSGNCGPRWSLVHDGAIWSANINDRTRRVTVMAIVADGYDTVDLKGTQAAVENNVAVVSAVIKAPKASLEVTGPDVQTRHVPLGDVGPAMPPS